MPHRIEKHISPPQLEHNLFESTSIEAGHVAMRFAGTRYTQILAILNEHPACIFEIAAKLKCHDHQISGRFGELVEHNCIRRTGTRRKKPVTNCNCDEYVITTIGLGIYEDSLKSPSTPVQKGNE